MGLLYCKECRTKKTEEKKIEEAKRLKSEYSSSGFGVKKTRNPAVIINGVKCIKCKGYCGEYKPLSDFYAAKGNINGVMNFCKVCYLENKKRGRKKV